MKWLFIVLKGELGFTRGGQLFILLQGIIISVARVEGIGPIKVNFDGRARERARGGGGRYGGDRKGGKKDGRERTLTIWCINSFNALMK